MIDPNVPLDGGESSTTINSSTDQANSQSSTQSNGNIILNSTTAPISMQTASNSGNNWDYCDKIANITQSMNGPLAPPDAASVSLPYMPLNNSKTQSSSSSNSQPSGGGSNLLPKGTQVMDPVSGFLPSVNYVFLGGRTLNGQPVGMDGRILGEFVINNTALDDSPLSFLMGGEFKSLNQLNKLIKTGKLPKAILRFDKAKIFGELDHVHFNNGSALNIDGTWKHGFKILTNDEIKILIENGWTIPK